MPDTITILVEIPMFNYSYLMEVTPTSTQGSSESYTITNLTVNTPPYNNSSTYTPPLIIYNEAIDQLFDPTNLSFVPSSTTINSVQFTDDTLYAFVHQYPYLISSETGSLSQYFYFYTVKSRNDSLSYVIQNGGAQSIPLKLSHYSPPSPTSTLGATCTLSSSGVDPDTGTVVTASSSASATASGDELKDALKALLEDVTKKLLLEVADNFSSNHEKATYTLNVKLDK